MKTAGDKLAARRDAAPTPASARGQPQQQSLSLAPREPVRQPLARTSRPGELWLALHFADLPLQSAALADEPLVAVYEERQGVRELLQVSPAAQAAGVHPGQSVNAALALLPGLSFEERDARRERERLEELAAWAERYTAFVVIEPPVTLLLELAASLRLFDGLRPLRRRVVRELAAQGYRASPAIAPTPLAATWLARAGSRRCITGRERLAGELGRLPLACLDWEPRTVASLQGMGIATVGELLRLPRDGFARRFGPRHLLELDRALGRLPDPRAHFRATERFCADTDLDAELDDREQLLGVCEQLLGQLEQFLLTRQLAVQRLSLQFFHLRCAATPLEIGCQQAERRADRWLELLRIRFERVELPEPVIALRLCAGDTQAMTAHSGALALAGERTACAPFAHLVERLSARIGEHAVQGVSTVAEHRPDYAWRTQPFPATPPQCQAAPGALHEQAPALFTDMQRTQRLLLRRPLWVLDPPRPLGLRDGQPWHDGVLALESGPERIETGWWSEAGVARDYYVARNPAGVYLWVYRDRADGGGWYLHGMFG